MDRQLKKNVRMVNLDGRVWKRREENRREAKRREEGGEKRRVEKRREVEISFIVMNIKSSKGKTRN